MLDAYTSDSLKTLSNSVMYNVTENTGDCHNLPQHSSPQPRTTQDILALFQSPSQSSPHQSSSRLSPAASVSLDATEILDGKENAAPTQPSASNDER